MNGLGVDGARTLKISGDVELSEDPFWRECVILLLLHARCDTDRETTIIVGDVVVLA